jgi:hypothetical protein
MSILYSFDCDKKGVLFEIMPPSFPWCEESLRTSMTAQVMDDSVLLQELNDRLNAKIVIDSLDQSDIESPSVEHDLYVEKFSSGVISYLASAIMYYLETPVSQRDKDFWIDFPPEGEYLNSRAQIEMPFPPHLPIPSELETPG